MAMKDVTPLTPLAHKRNSLFDYNHAAIGINNFVFLVYQGKDFGTKNIDKKTYNY